MRLPIQITIHYGLLAAVAKIIGILMAGYIAIVIITVLFELRLGLLFSLNFWLISWIESGFLFLAIALPICFAPFIRPSDKTWQARLLQGVAIMAVASPAFVWAMTKTLSMPLNSNGSEHTFQTSMALLVPFYIINAALYLPGIFGWGRG